MVDTILCKCGCGTEIDRLDKWGRSRRYVSGHNRRKYEDPTQYKREWNHRNRSQRYQYKSSWLRKLKAKFVMELGGKCSNCMLPYSGKNACVFDFHHIDPSLKDFNLSMGTLNRMSVDALREELAKCVLLCSNCHRLVHSSEY